MSVSYKKLWKLLIDRDIKKKDLCVSAGISPSSLAKLGKSENVNTDILVKICNALNCDVSDIMEVKPVSTEKEESENENHAPSCPESSAGCLFIHGSIGFPCLYRNREYNALHIIWDCLCSCNLRGPIHSAVPLDCRIVQIFCLQEHQKATLRPGCLPAGRRKANIIPIDGPAFRWCSREPERTGRSRKATVFRFYSPGFDP